MVSAPKPNRPILGTNSTGSALPLFAFLPTPSPSFQPIPRNMAAPKSSIGIDSYASIDASSGKSSTSSLNASNSFSAKLLPMNDSFLFLSCSFFLFSYCAFASSSFGPILVNPYVVLLPCAVSPPIVSDISNRLSSSIFSLSVGRKLGACGDVVVAQRGGEL